MTSVAWAPLVLQRRFDHGVIVTDDEDDGEGHGRACDVGRRQASVSLGIRVSPCSFLDDAFGGPSVRDHGSFARWRQHAVFRAVRDDDAGRVPGCDGGCRSRALAVDGSVQGAEPWRTSGDAVALEQRRAGRMLAIVAAPAAEER
jgi:MoaA/NifB/PqqE/SkfB family radical SAM enzyme